MKIVIGEKGCMIVYIIWNLFKVSGFWVGKWIEQIFFQKEYFDSFLIDRLEGIGVRGRVMW